MAECLIFMLLGAILHTNIYLGEAVMDTSVNYEELLELTVSLAARLQKSGAETYRVEETIVRTVGAYGVEKVDAFVIPGSIFGSLETDDGQVYTKIRRIQNSDTSIDGIERYSALCRRLCRETPPIREAKKLLAETDASVRTYNLFIYYLADFILAAGFAIFFKGTIMDALSAGICGVATGFFMRLMGFLNANTFFKTFAGGFIIAFSAYGLAAIGICDNADVASIGTMMMLVPGFLFTNSLRDIIYGDTMSGVNRLVQVLIIAVALVVGTGTAVSLTRHLWGAIPGSENLVEHGLAVECAAGMIGSLGYSLMINTHGKGLIHCMFGSVIASFVCSTCIRLGLPEPASYFIAAGISAFYAEIVARIRKHPATSYLMAALVPLIPGAGIYYTMNFIAANQGAEAWSKGLATAAISGAMAVGVLFVSTGFRMWGEYKRRRAVEKTKKAE